MENTEYKPVTGKAILILLGFMIAFPIIVYHSF